MSSYKKLIKKGKLGNSVEYKIYELGYNFSNYTYYLNPATTLIQFRQNNKKIKPIFVSRFVYNYKELNISHMEEIFIRENLTENFILYIFDKKDTLSKLGFGTRENGIEINYCKKLDKKYEFLAHCNL